MQIILLGLLCVGANLLLLAVFIPASIAFHVGIIFQIAFWTLAGITGAKIVMIMLKKNFVNYIRIFLNLTYVVFGLSFIPIYLQMGILKEFPPLLLNSAVDALIAMHFTDSVIISALIIYGEKWNIVQSSNESVLPSRAS